MEPHHLKKQWFDQALRRAGIAPRSWRPHHGLAENRRVVKAVYTYYGELFLEHPHLLWAGMAAMIGPAFYAGFRDLGMVPDAMRRAVVAVCGRRSRRFASWAASDLGFYEITFLTMQKKIFEDLAWMHEAYLSGGIPQIDALYRDRIIDIATLRAWQEIDKGRHSKDEAAAARGNRALLFREQHNIIDRFYVRMQGFRKLEGQAFTYLLTLAGTPSIPGAHSYPKHYPLRITLRFRRIAICARTPLAGGNIAIFADRWKLIDADTLPRYFALVRDDIDKVRNELRTPLAKRIRRYRLLVRAPGFAWAALTRWGLNIKALRGYRYGDVHGGGTFARRAQPFRESIRINLEHLPTRESAGLAAYADSLTWMNRGREPIDVEVCLPDNKVYRARAAMTTILTTALGKDPDRLIVQLLPMVLADVGQLVDEYSAEWGFPSQAADTWRTSAYRRASGWQRDDADNETYTTHVFTPDSVNFVHIEFHVSHHIYEDEFVLAALFSWEVRDRQ